MYTLHTNMYMCVCVWREGRGVRERMRMLVFLWIELEIERYEDNGNNNQFMDTQLHLPLQVHQAFLLLPSGYSHPCSASLEPRKAA